MPVPQRINFLVEQASCLLLTMVQDVSSAKALFFSKTKPWMLRSYNHLNNPSQAIHHRFEKPLATVTSIDSNKQIQP
ncbi:hypothetical protein [Microcoleus vaginatus]|uniref:hypothetical protein n=1 Tax=Microcoleus vaginatus TaxID=119532 RepID=UPI001F60D560|nr:hypothetical protein D0A37_24410 [Microcoleus vaginatus HSN003]